MMFWCLLLVTINDGGKAAIVETAVQGISLEIKNDIIKLDVSEYAKKQRYQIPDIIYVNRDQCVTN